jgi:hypothetical protein
MNTVRATVSAFGLMALVACATPEPAPAPPPPPPPPKVETPVSMPAQEPKDS